MNINKLIKKRELENHWLYANSHDEAKKKIEQRALNVYFLFRALFNEWVEENLEPDAEYVFEALRFAEKNG